MPPNDPPGRDPTGPTSPIPPPQGPSGPRLGEQPGDWIGPYKLLEIIGEGGFGTVWLAERREPMVQRVALKLLLPGMHTKEVLARFEQERQALAAMNHPNVAKVLDAGATTQGLPYFVMEYVPGEAITDYCDRHRLDIPQRLKLFIEVCDAVQHAHHKGIIHRDLKPSNILVMVVESGEARPVVVDFGAAKALAGRLTDHTIFTPHGRPVGTWQYMSPEQAEMAETEVDTRSDVYSLGVILYELLTGAVPFDGATLRKVGAAAIQRFIREADPPRPSTRLSGMGKTSEVVAAARRTRQDDLASVLRRELEWIPLMALRKDRTERYRSASELADDVGNYLADRPLIAGPEGAAYKARKFVRRNKGLVTAACAIAAVLSAGVVGVAWQAKVAREAATRESKARERAETISRFVTSALRRGDPQQGGRQDTTIVQAMDSSIRDLDSGRFKDEPETEAILTYTIAMILLNNGRAEEADRLMTRAMELYERVHSGDDPNVAACLNGHGLIMEALGRPQEAETLYVKVTAMHERLQMMEHPDRAAVLANIASARQTMGRDAAAEAPLAEALAILRQVHKRDHQDLALCLSNLGGLQYLLGRTAEAAEKLEEARAMFDRLGNPDDPLVVGCLVNLAYVRLAQDRADEAEPLAVRALERCRELFTGDHPYLAEALYGLGRVRFAQGQFAEAESLHTQAVIVRQSLYKGRHPDIADSLNELGAAVRAQGRIEEAEQFYLESLAMRREIYQGDHPKIVASLRNAAHMMLRQDRSSEAESLLREALAMGRRCFGGDHKELSQCMNDLAMALDDIRYADEKEALLIDALAMDRRLGSADCDSIAISLTNLAMLHHSLGQHERARTELDEAVAMQRRLSPNGSTQLAQILGLSGTVHVLRREFRAGLPQLEDAVKLGRRFLLPDDPNLVEMRSMLARCKEAIKTEEK